MYMMSLGGLGVLGGVHQGIYMGLGIFHQRDPYGLRASMKWIYRGLGGSLKGDLQGPCPVNLVS